MGWVKRNRPPVTGNGVLRLGSAERTVLYSLTGDPAQLRKGPKGLRGSIEAEPAIAEEAFRFGDGYLVLAEGSEFRMKALAHTRGSATVYIELWRAP